MAAHQKIFRKRFTIPLWVVQTIILLLFLVSGCAWLAIAGQADDIYTDRGPDAVRLLRIVAGALVAVVSICLLLILAEIICSARHKLKPAFYLGAGCLRALLSLVYFIIVVAGAAIAISTSGYALILSIVMLAASIGQVIYGSIIVHRVRKGVYSSVAQGDGSTAYNGSFTGRMQNDVEMRAGRDVMYR